MKPVDTHRGLRSSLETVETAQQRLERRLDEMASHGPVAILQRLDRLERMFAAILASEALNLVKLQMDVAAQDLLVDEAPRHCPLIGEALKKAGDK